MFLAIIFLPQRLRIAIQLCGIRIRGDLRRLAEHRRRLPNAPRYVSERHLTDVGFGEAASLPVVAITAWQMPFDYAKIQPGQRILILGASGSVGSIAVELAHRHGAYTIAAAASDDGQRLMQLGADQVVNLRDPTTSAFPAVDAVIDAAGGDQQRRGMALLKRGGYIVSSVSAPDPALMEQRDAHGRFFLVQTTTYGLQQISDLIDRGALKSRVGTVMPLREAQVAHQMLDGAKPHVRGKIVLITNRNE